MDGHMLGETTTANGAQCKARTRDGRPCQANAGASGYCFVHDPALREQRKQARSNGGKARHGRRITWSDHGAPISVRSTDDVLALLERACLGEMGLENSSRRNRTIASLALAALKALEVGELEERLRRLEEATNARP